MGKARKRVCGRQSPPLGQMGPAQPPGDRSIRGTRRGPRTIGLSPAAGTGCVRDRVGTAFAGVYGAQNGTSSGPRALCPLDTGRKAKYLPSPGRPVPRFRGRSCSGYRLRKIKTMSEGTIKRLTDKGFGFIEMGTGKDMFFHNSNLEGTSFEQLREGDRVSFTEGEGPKGPRAENVRVL